MQFLLVIVFFVLINIFLFLIRKVGSRQTFFLTYIYFLRVSSQSSCCGVLPGSRAGRSNRASRATVFPFCCSCCAISKATRTPKEWPPRKYGPEGWRDWMGRSPLFLLIKSWASNKGEKLSPIQGFCYRKKLEWKCPALLPYSRKRSKHLLNWY